MEGEEDNSSPLFSYNDSMLDVLNNALDIGIKENEFWDMTLAEVNRAFDSYKRVKLAEAKQQATMDYMLAQVISLGVSRAFNGGDDFPAIEEIYPSLFQERVIEAQKAKEELSILRFKQFANQHNKKYTEGG